VPGGLVRAFAISIALHVFLLWPAVPVWREAAPTAPLTASLRPSAAPVAPSVPTALPKPPTAARPAPPPPLPRVPDQTTVNTTTPSDLTASSSFGSEASATPAAHPAPSAVYSALPPRSGVDAEGLRSYRLALAREARRHKRYPAKAIAAGWSGTAEVRVSVTPGRGVPVAQLTKSSGHAALDEAALEMLRLAMPATPVPAPLQERAFSVDLPIVFELPE
jgi:protein TonB